MCCFRCSLAILPVFERTRWEGSGKVRGEEREKECMDTRTSLTTLVCRMSSFYIPPTVYLNVNHRATCRWSAFQLLPGKVMYRSTAVRRLFSCPQKTRHCFKSYWQVSTAVPRFAENLMGLLAVDPATLSAVLRPVPPALNIFQRTF